MRTTLELPDLLFARLKARAARERVTLKQLLHTYLEQGLNATPDRAHGRRSAASLPRLEGPLPIAGEPLSNAGLFEWLDDA
ncbi:hypothetical protein H6G65_17965 [Microcystis elabens FACHB-917]|nr:hypothetical protein [Microcystis elabens FACHB-917]